MSAVRHSESSTRNLVVMLAALACFVVAALGQMHGAASWWLLVVGLPGVAALAAWLQDTRSGWTVTERQVRFHIGHDWELRLSPEQIDHARRVRDPDGPDSVLLTLRNGQTREVPTQCVDRASRVLDALAQAGIRIDEPL